MAEEKPEELDFEQMAEMMRQKENITERLPRIISVEDKIYRVKQISKAVASRVHKLELEAYYLKARRAGEMTLKQAQRADRKLERLHAKTAAYYLCGNMALFVPFKYLLTWHRLMMRDEEHSYRINEAAANDKNVNFSSANWEISKLRLALSMKPIGEGVKQYLKRWESATAQLDEDATPKSQPADSKSEPSSLKAPKTKK